MSNEEPQKQVEEAERYSEIVKLEGLIAKGPGEIEPAREQLRNILIRRAGVSAKGTSIGDALLSLSEKPKRHKEEAALILRCLEVQGLVPEANSSNNIIRSIVTLVEEALPEIINYLKIEKKEQNYKKYERLVPAHQIMLELLKPLKSPFTQITDITKFDREITGCMSHGVLRTYCIPYRLEEVRFLFANIIDILKKISLADQSLLLNIKDCERILENTRADYAESQTFIIRDYLFPFLDKVSQALESFIVKQTGRFATQIEFSSPTSGELQKRYPLHEHDKEIRLVVPLRNVGPGMALDVRAAVSTDSEALLIANEDEFIFLGNVMPGEFSINLDAIVIEECSSFSQILTVEWSEIGSPKRFSEIFEYKILAQSKNINWTKIEYDTPYSTDVAEGDQFIGRSDKLKPLAARLLRQPMEPFYITGQKRVGKTSLALAAANIAEINNQNGKLASRYILWGSVAHADPKESLRNLGEAICNFISSYLPAGVERPNLDFSGSLSGLIGIADLSMSLLPDQKYVIILDEFDEIPEELFLKGNLAETFFANLRALSRCKNVCLLLIGGENMPFIMDRQGQKLNNFSRINLSYFSRESEWSDFQELVKKPTTGILNWHDDAISEVFNITNGNPYFAKLVCASVFAVAVNERDADITSAEVKRAIERSISDMGANSFAHLWQDGIPKAIDERDPDILRRMRVLVALARCRRAKRIANITEISGYKATLMLTEAEIGVVLNDFVKRDVLRDDEKKFSFVLPIFEMWLTDIGVSQLIADGLNEELASIQIGEENRAYVQSSEVVEIASSWQTYRGKTIGTDEVRAWIEQVDSYIDQRILFEILKRVKFYSEAKIGERLKSAHSALLRKLPEFVIKSRGQRRDDVILTYIDGQGKSGGSYASQYAEENGISTSCIFEPSQFNTRFKEHKEAGRAVNAVVIVDDIAATGKSLCDNFEKFIVLHNETIQEIPILLVTLVATVDANNLVQRRIEEYKDCNVEFRTCETLEPSAFAFPDDRSVWPEIVDPDRAYALCNDLGSKIYKRNPLGYGGLGLLVVFPTTVPNNSLPILHSHSRSASGDPWRPIFERVVN